MRKFIIGLAMASTALAAPALARDRSWYAEADGGVVFVKDIHYQLPTGAPAGTLDTKAGFDVGGIIGYDFGMIRLEVEDSYRRAGVKTLNNFPGAVRGNVSAFSVMLNALLDFGPDDGLQGFVGGGAGVARVWHSIGSTSSSNLLHDNDSGKFAWQALAGVRYPLSDHWDVGLKYRYFNTDKIDLVAADGTRLRSNFRSHSAMATLAYNFGGETEVLAPPPKL
jgi:OOP family OmpA-OmpF porin